MNPGQQRVGSHGADDFGLAPMLFQAVVSRQPSLTILAAHPMRLPTNPFSISGYREPGVSRQRVSERRLKRGTGGWGRFRTPEALAGLPVFKTGAFSRSATHPCPMPSSGNTGIWYRTRTSTLRSTYSARPGSVPRLFRPQNPRRSSPSRSDGVAALMASPRLRQTRDGRCRRAIGSLLHHQGTSHCRRHGR